MGNRFWVTVCFSAVVIGAASGTWFLTSKLIIPNDSNMECLLKDPARVIYESRSIASYATTIVVSSAVVFIPLLTFIWSNAKKTITDTLDILMSLLGNRRINQKLLDEKIEQAGKTLREIKNIGETYKYLFFGTVVIIVLFLIFIGFVNFYKFSPSTSYACFIWSYGFSIVVFFLLLVLISIYQFKGLPIIRPYEDRAAFFENKDA